MCAQITPHTQGDVFWAQLAQQEVAHRAALRRAVSARQGLCAIYFSRITGNLSLQEFKGVWTTDVEQGVLLQGGVIIAQADSLEYRVANNRP